MYSLAFLSWMNLFFNAWSFFFFNDTATTEIYTLSLHDALPFSQSIRRATSAKWVSPYGLARRLTRSRTPFGRSEEHTSELQSHLNLVCRLLLEKKKTKKKTQIITTKIEKNKLQI